MNCCKNHNEKKDNNLISSESKTHASAENNAGGKPAAHNPIRHMLHMLVCCGLPILLILVLPAIGYKGFLLKLVPYICPVMMLLMIPMMLRGHGCGSAGESCHMPQKLAKDEDSPVKNG